MVKAFAGSDDAERIPADVRLHQRLANQGFSGPEYARFVEDVARYGLRVVEAWLLSGLMFQRVKERNPLIRLAPPESWSRQDRLDIAAMVVAKALRRFRQDALLGGSWRPELGASLATYFVGMCIDEFPNEFKRWRRRQRGATNSEMVAPRQGRSEPPEEVIMAIEAIAERLKQLPEGQREALVLDAEGFKTSEIATILDTTELAVGLRLRRGRGGLRGSEADRDE